MALDVRILRSSFNALAPRAEGVARAFYGKLFERYPELRPLFARADMTDQTQKLVRALTVIVRSVDDQAVLSGFLMRMGRTHVEYGVRDEHYAQVGDTLLDTLAQSIGPIGWTPIVEQTWREALRTVCELMRAGAASSPSPDADSVEPEAELAGIAAGSETALAAEEASSPEVRAFAPKERHRKFTAADAADSASPLRPEPAGGLPTDVFQEPDMTLGTLPSSPASTHSAGVVFSPGMDASHFYALAELSPTALFVENGEGRLTYANLRGQDLLRQLAAGLGGAPRSSSDRTPTSCSRACRGTPRSAAVPAKPARRNSRSAASSWT